MKVGWLADDPLYAGGAELTQAEFRAAVPTGIEIVDCPAGEVVPGLDAYAVHNCVGYSMADAEAMGSAPAVKYVNDCWPDAIDPEFRTHLLTNAVTVFCSPLHLRRFPSRDLVANPRVIPPAVDLEPFRKARRLTNGHRSRRNVCVGRMVYGKGAELLAEYPEPVEVWSTVPLESHGNLVFRGEATRADLPRILTGYQRFVFLPTALEPFGRGVVEAWAAGCGIVVNGNVGAAYWLRRPVELSNASSAFWGLFDG